MAGNNLGVAKGSIQVNTSDLKNADIALRSAGTSMVVFGAVAVAGFAAVVGEAAKFEKEMDFVQAVTQASTSEMEALSKAALDLAKDSVFGPNELAKSFVDLAKAGATVQQIIVGVGEAAVNLAQAADVPVPFAGENLLNILNTFKLGAKDAVHVTDLLAGAANASSVELSDIVESMRYAGPVAAAMGIDISDLNDALTLLGKVGIKGSIAGTSLRMAMTRLTSPTAKAKDALESIGLTVENGMVKQFTNADGSIKSLAEVMQVLQDATRGLTGQAKVAVVNDIFGVRSMPSVIELMSQGAAGFEAINEEINRTTAADVAAKRIDNLDGAIKRLKATLSAMFVEAGGPFQKMLKSWVDGAREFLLFIDRIPGPLLTVLVGVVGVIGVLSLMSGIFLLTIGNIVRMIRVIGELRNVFALFTVSARTATAANGALNASFLANPIFLVAAAIAALIAAVVLLYFHFKPFREFIDAMWQSIQRFWDRVLNVIKGAPEKIGKAIDAIARFFGRIPQYASTAWTAVKGFFGRLPELIGGWVSSAAGIVGRFFSGIGGKIGNFFGTVFGAVGRAVGSAAGAVGRFFTKLPGVIGRALSSAADAVGRFVTEFPAKFAYAFGFVVGRSIRFGKDFVGSFLKIGDKVIQAVAGFMGRLPGYIYRGLKTALLTVVRWGKDIALGFIKIGGAVLIAVGRFVEKIPMMIFNALFDALLFLVQNIPKWGQAGWDLGSGIFSGIWGFISQIPGMIGNLFMSAIQVVWSTVSGFVSSAWAIGNGVFNAIIDFFMALPGKIGELLWDAVLAVGRFISRMYDKAREIGDNLWQGIKDGLGIGSPSYIERAIWAIEGNMADSVSNMGNHLRVLQGMGSRLPELNAGVVGLPSAGNAAVASNGGGQIWQQNAPLIGSATIKDERDAVTLARTLATEQQRQARARGQRMVGVN